MAKNAPIIESQGRTIVALQPLLRAEAGKMLRRLPSFISFDDVRSAGLLGLIRAARRADPDRAIEPFAIRCIRGAILDWLRTLDHVPRRERARRRKAGEDDSDRPCSLDAIMSEGWSPGSTPPDQRAAVIRGETATALASSIAKLSPIEREIVERTSLGDEILSAIAAEKGLTESRICQIRSAALKRLRRLLDTALNA